MILDTNILVAYLNGEIQVINTIDDWKTKGFALFVSVVSASEALSLPTLSPQDIEDIRRFLGGFIILPYDERLVENVAMLRRTYRLALPDAAIAASAIFNHLQLI